LNLLAPSKAGEVSSKDLQRRDFLISGNMWKVIISISLPLFLYALLNCVNDVLDNFMCASLSTAAVSASAQMSQVKNMVVAIGSGISAGGSIMIAREIGKKNYKQAQHLTSTVFTVVFFIAGLTLLICIPFARPLLIAFGVDEGSADVGLSYFRILMGSASLSMLNSVYMGVEKARGATKFITFLNVMTVVIKVALNSIFIYGMKVDDMTWVALATLIATGSLTVFILIRLFFTNYLFRYDIHGLDFSPKTAKRLTSLSFPIFLGKFIFSFGKVSVNAMANTYGATAKGALGISNNMGGMITTGLSSFEDTESAIISTNLGAGKEDRAISCFYCTLIIELVLGISGVGIISIPQVNDAIVRLFATSSKEGYNETFAKMISEIFFYEKLGIVTLGINSAVLGLLYGYGYTRLSMVINIARVFVFRIPSLWFCQQVLHMTSSDLSKGDYKALGYAMGFSNICIGIVAIITGIAVILRIKKMQREKEAARMLTEEEKERTETFIKKYLSSYTHYKPGTEWCYEDGVLMKGCAEMHKATKDKFYLDCLISFYDGAIAEDGSIRTYSPDDKNIDNIQPGTALQYLNQLHHEDKYDKALALLAGQLKNMDRTKSGSFWHKKRYPYQIWLDGIYMGLPFYANLSCEEHSIKMKRDIVKQFYNVESYNWDDKKKAYLHCYDETKSMIWADKNTGRSPNVWLRSVGWLAMADADVYETFKDKGGLTEALRLKPLLKKVLSSLEPYKDKESRLYYDLPLLKDEKGNYLETSGSLMFAYAYLKGARIGMIKHEELAKGAEMLESVIKNYLKEDGLHNICKVSGLSSERDGSVKYYLSEPVVVNDTKGVGPLLMAYAEYLRAVK
jgi:rhamnogalacturonyl hydrolase YesR/Na+-driven multidrug efflux pump